ncbi:hypothetical protein, partial [Pseudomonas sp. FSL R10-1350]|uniref:hypothetical protein n=1 Tax=Pseudomonas sp. FSL R10-1350 TaxID=2662197 RepID=UPI0015B4EB87
SGSLKVFAHGFTAQMRQMMRNNPHFSAISKMVADVEWTREARDIDILYGKDGGTNGKGFFFRLKGPESEKAVVPAMYTMKNKDISGIFDLLADG